MKTHRFDVNSPVFIIGRGGSGTRLLSKLLIGCNIYLGSRINKQGDSMEWVKLNRAMLQAGIYIRSEKFNSAWQEKLRNLAGLILDLAPSEKYERWGAKLPEFMLFLPELMAVFPDAQIIHLCRNPVSLSLRRSHVSSRLGNKVGDVVLPLAYQSLGMDVNINDQAEHINNAVSWQYQLNQVTTFAEQNLSTQNYHLIRFEDIIKDHQGVLDGVCDFLKLTRRTAIGLNIDHTRANADNIPVDLADQVWKICGTEAEKIGYKKIHG